MSYLQYIQRYISINISQRNVHFFLFINHFIYNIISFTIVYLYFLISIFDDIKFINLHSKENIHFVKKKTPLFIIIN